MTQLEQCDNQIETISVNKVYGKLVWMESVVSLLTAVSRLFTLASCLLRFVFFLMFAMQMVYVVRLVRAPVEANVATMKLFCAKCSPTPSTLLSLNQGVKMLFRRKIPIVLFIFLLFVFV